MSNEQPTAVFEVTPEAKSELTSLFPTASVTKAYESCSDTWIPSQFNVSVDLPDNKKAVYNTLTSALTILRRDSWRKYFSRGSKYHVRGKSIRRPMHLLYAKGFFISKNIDELEIVKQQFLFSRYRNDLLSLNVVPTLRCNLRCPYCFEGKAQITRNCKSMSKETEQAVVDYIARISREKRRVQIVWFGGEPLLAVGAIERISTRIIPRFDRAGIEYHALLSTNGTLLTRSVVKLLHACKIFLLQVTVDIPKSTKQDARGRDTRDKVLDNIAIAVEKLRIHIRINCTQDNESEFVQLYDGLVRRNLHRRVQSINIANVFEPECARDCCVAPHIPQQSYLQILRRETARAKVLGLPFMTFVPLTKASNGGCAATRDSCAAIGPDGLLYKCVEDLGLVDRAYGSIFLKRPTQFKNLIPWLNYDWFQYDMCKKCPVLPQCAGGCAHKRRFQSGKLKDDDHCYWFIRGNLENRIREFALKSISV